MKYARKLLETIDIGGTLYAICLRNLSQLAEFEYFVLNVSPLAPFANNFKFSKNVLKLV